jgi:hypothetical protein
MKEIYQFNSNTLALPDEGDVEFVLDIHPQYVHLEEALHCWQEHLKCLQVFMT